MKKQSLVMRSLAMVSQFGIYMVVPIGMCSAAGYFLDKWLETNFCFVVLFFVGALAGFRNIYVLARSIFADGDGKEKQDASGMDEDTKE